MSMGFGIMAGAAAKSARDTYEMLTEEELKRQQAARADEALKIQKAGESREADKYKRDTADRESADAMARALVDPAPRTALPTGGVAGSSTAPGNPSAGVPKGTVAASAVTDVDRYRTAYAANPSAATLKILQDAEDRDRRNRQTDSQIAVAQAGVDVQRQELVQRKAEHELRSKVVSQELTTKEYEHAHKVYADKVRAASAYVSQLDGDDTVVASDPTVNDKVGAALEGMVDAYHFAPDGKTATLNKPTKAGDPYTIDVKDSDGKTTQTMQFRTLADVRRASDVATQVADPANYAVVSAMGLASQRLKMKIDAGERRDLMIVMDAMHDLDNVPDEAAAAASRLGMLPGNNYVAKETTLDEATGKSVTKEVNKFQWLINKGKTPTTVKARDSAGNEREIPLPKFVESQIGKLPVLLQHSTPEEAIGLLREEAIRGGMPESQFRKGVYKHLIAAVEQLQGANQRTALPVDAPPAPAVPARPVYRAPSNVRGAPGYAMPSAPPTGRGGSNYR